MQVKGGSSMNKTMYSKYICTMCMMRVYKGSVNSYVLRKIKAKAGSRHMSKPAKISLVSKSAGANQKACHVKQPRPLKLSFKSVQRHFGRSNTILRWIDISRHHHHVCSHLIYWIWRLWMILRSLCSYGALHSESEDEEHCLVMENFGCILVTVVGITDSIWNTRFIPGINLYYSLNEGAYLRRGTQINGIHEHPPMINPMHCSDSAGSFRKREWCHIYIITSL